MRILIDTNIYLDFYRSNKDALKIFDQVIIQSDSIILTDQIIEEFYRNREKIIKTIRRSFESDSKIEDFSSSFLQTLGEFQQLISIQKEFKAKRKEIVDTIILMQEDISKDPVASYFKEFMDKKQGAGQILDRTDEIIARSHKRKMIGNPPASDKYSMGDEINWEIILENIKDDILIVGRDNTFIDNISFLKVDFHKNTGRFISGLTDKITVALQQLGINPGEDLEKIEKNQIDEIAHYGTYWISTKESGEKEN